jgi:uncharacterized membrane protein YsdA (DUF1294 family)
MRETMQSILRMSTLLKPLLTLPAFALLYLVLAAYWHVPRIVALVYLLMSLLCFVVYAWDKSAARAGRWRTRESTLLLLGLLCGWPGALLAQLMLRHKTAKTSFQIAFWVTAVLNVAGFVVLTLKV